MVTAKKSPGLKIATKKASAKTAAAKKGPAKKAAAKKAAVKKAAAKKAAARKAPARGARLQTALTAPAPTLKLAALMENKIALERSKGPAGLSDADLASLHDVIGAMDLPANIDQGLLDRLNDALNPGKSQA